MKQNIQEIPQKRVNRVNIATSKIFMRTGVDIWCMWKWFDSRLIHQSWSFLFIFIKTAVLQWTWGEITVLHERVVAIWGASCISMPLYNCFVNVCLLGTVRAPLIEKGNEIYEWVMYVWFFKERILWWSREGNKNDIVEANLLDNMPDVQSHILSPLRESLKSFEMSLNIEPRRSLQDSYKPQEINNTGWFDEWRPRSSCNC